MNIDTLKQQGEIQLREQKKDAQQKRKRKDCISIKHE
jgi:hypothetical protein